MRTEYTVKASNHAEDSHSRYLRGQRCAYAYQEHLVCYNNKHERGLRVYMCGRWEIQREGEKGSFGEIVEAVIS